MKRHRKTAMLGSVNEYSHLKWPITVASILTTILAFVLLQSFRSNSWFTYELIHSENSSTTTSYSRMVEYGSIGLWTRCTGHYDNPAVTCDVWTKETRPHSFNVLIVLIVLGLFLSNLTVFPSWGTSILILYNANNRYIRHIVGFIWILLLLTLSCTLVLMVAMLLTALTEFYSPGKYTINTDHLHFRSGPGLFYAGIATLLSILALIIIIITLIWKKMIEMRLHEDEKDFFKQISNDNYQPGWHRIMMAPRTPGAEGQIGEPPPYEY